MDRRGIRDGGTGSPGGRTGGSGVGSVIAGVGAGKEMGYLLRMNRLFLKRTLPLCVLTKCFLYGPIAVMTPYVSRWVLDGNMVSHL